MLKPNKITQMKYDCVGYLILLRCKCIHAMDVHRDESISGTSNEWKSHFLIFSLVETHIMI